MLRLKRNVFLGLLLVSTLLVVGCSGDNKGSTSIEYVDRTMTVIVGEESGEFKVDIKAFDSEGDNDITWIGSNSNVSFNSPNKESTTVRGEEVGMTQIRVKVGDTYSEWIDFEVLGEKNYRYFRGEKESGFYSIAATEGPGGYLGVGFNKEGAYDRLYLAKADSRGLTMWDKELGDDNRYYEIQEVIEFDGYYYLIGYQRDANNNRKAYISKLDSEGNVVENYIDGTNLAGEYNLLRGGTLVEDNGAAKIVAVGQSLIGGRNLPYIVTIGIGSGEVHYEVLQYDRLNETYYNLESIVRGEDRYLIVGFAGENEDDSKGILFGLNYNTMENEEGKKFNLKINPINFDEGVWKISGEEDGEEFIVVGDNGYVAKVGVDGGFIVSPTAIGSGRTFRDALAIGGEDGEKEYILVGTYGNGGVAVKVKVAIEEPEEGVVNKELKLVEEFGKEGVAKFGTGIYSIVESIDGHYLLAGTGERDEKERAYVVKIDDHGNIVDRNLDNKE